MRHLVCTFFLCLSAILSAKDYTVVSPDGNLTMTFGVGEKVTYTVKVGDVTLVAPSCIALELEGGLVLGEKPKVSSVRKGEKAETIVAPLYRQSSIESEYNSLVLKMNGDWGIEARAFNDGVAYRLFTTFKKDIKIKNEVVEFNFDKDYQMTLPYSDLFKDKYIASFEKQYETEPVSHFKNHEGRLSFMPIMLHYDNAAKVILLESDVENYPGMFVNYNKEKLGLVGEFPPYPLKHKDTSNGVLRVSERAPYIASVEGNRAYPWRIVAYAADEKQVPVNNMVYALASPCRIENTSWIKPGRSTWDWWNHCSIYNVDFKVGFNNDTYKYYIDFASKYGVEYILLDEGWAKTTYDPFTPNENLDLQELIRYGKEKNVGIILWLTWLSVENNFDLFAKFADWGVKGVKIDFMDRSDQWMVNYYERVASEAAKHRLFVDFHGSFKPAGLEYKYPNVLSTKG